MSSKIKILIVEHNLNDIELIRYELKKGGIDFVSEIVQNEMGYRNALKNFIPDIILSDYALPSFDGRAAFEIREQITPGTPFIFVSGSIGEENSIEFIKNGVTDYVLKDKLFTLTVKVKRALSDAKEKQQKNNTEQELIQSERRLARAQELAHMGSWEIDMIDNTQTWSGGMYKIYGIDHKEHPSTELFLSFIHPDDLAFSKSHVAKAYSTFSDGSFNFRFTRKDGELRYGYTEYRVDFDQNKKPLRLYGIVQDVSEMKKAEENLKQSENRFRAIIEKGTDMKTLSTVNGEMIYGSPSITKVLGYSLKELLHKSAINFIHPDDIPGYMENRKEILQTPGKSVFNQIRLRHKNGNWIWCEGIITNMLHEAGINALVSNYRDISEKKIAEKQQEFDSINLSALINNTKDLMWSVDKDFKLITSNQPFDETIRHISGQAIAKGSNILAPGFSPEQLKRFKIFYDRAFSGESFTEIEYTGIPDEIWSEISYHPIRKGVEIIGTACFSRDITERKLSELERIKITNDLSQRNKDLEEFAYIVSHNLRAPVANILGAANRLSDPGLSTEKKDLLRNGLNESVTMLDGVVKDLNHILQVKREINEIKEKVCFSELVDNIKISIKNLIDRDNVEIKYDFSEIDEFLTLKSYMYSIFYNLISNSIKYRQQQVPGIIEIKSHRVNDAMELIFTDNGMGIDLQKKGGQVFGLYKRFHTNIEGKGIGLFMVKTQVETLGGKISIRSEVNKGTEFKIEFEI
jgi:PAS domain S-box-containing protein